MTGSQRRETLGADIVAEDLVIEILTPVDMHRAGNVAGVIQQHILIALDDADIGIVKMLGQPLRADQGLRVGVGREFIAHGVWGLSGGRKADHTASLKATGFGPGPGFSMTPPPGTNPGSLRNE